LDGIPHQPFQSLRIFRGLPLLLIEISRIAPFMDRTRTDKIMAVKTPDIENYTISADGLLGEGVFGSSWVGLFHGKEPRVLKVLEPDRIENGFRKEQLENLFSLDEPPGTVPILERGETKAGAPFVAMRMMGELKKKGKGWTSRNLITGLNEEKSDAGDKSRIVREIAVTMAFYHRHDIVHADLKPSNILLTGGEEPRPLISDFGQNRRDDLPYSETGRGQFYASPEQLRYPDKPTKSWDVYSFGVLAFELLTGKLPRLNDIAGGGVASSDDLPALLIENRDIAIPKDLSRDDADLFAILKRCLSLNNRFEDMEQVAEAIEAADRKRDTAAQRKLTLIVGCVAGALSLVAAIAVWFAFSTGGSLDDEREAHEGIRDAMVRLEEEANVSESQRVLAEKVATEAREKSATAQQATENALDGKQKSDFDAQAAHSSRNSVENALVNTLAELQAELAPIGRLGLLETASSNAADYFDALPEAHRNGATQKARATLSEHRGDVLLAGGKLGEAIQAYEQSVALRREAIEAASDPIPAHMALGASLAKLGDARLESAEIEEALADLEESLEILKWISTIDLNETAPKAAVVKAMVKFGDAQLAVGKADDAFTTYEKAQQVAIIVAQFSSDNLEYQLGICQGLARLGDCERARGNLESAREFHSKSLDQLRTLSTANPDNELLQSELSAELARLGEVSEAPEAARLFEESAGVLETLVESDQINPTWRRRLAIAQDRLGDARSESDPIAAGIHYRSSIKTVQQLLASDQAPETWRLKQIITLYKLADLDKKRGASEIAASRYKEALTWLREMQNSGLLTEKDEEWILKIEQALEGAET
jgi:serine/threonine protein kinase